MADDKPTTPPSPTLQQQAPPPPFKPDRELIGSELRGDDRPRDYKTERR